MTVSAQVKQTLASLKGVRATLETFAQIEQNNEAREAFSSGAREIGLVIGDLEKRVGLLEFQEPQYKGF
ncbi:MAG: hypothetical protein JL50_21450 [Peptococcaceae bacterium BICA1-7]|nr:MAG: hypothetical protein JL50_21450 [Peptococcaceae bacterium BICA1-7]HBV97104.1 DUF1657 domain-containing protein [Desulfotomaculum sp.]